MEDWLCQMSCSLEMKNHVIYSVSRCRPSRFITIHTINGFRPRLSKAISARSIGKTNSTIYHYGSVENCNPRFLTKLGNLVLPFEH